MLRKLLSHLTYANVMATIAVFIALGGGAYAVSTAPKNSVVSKSIKNGQVKSADVQDDGLTGADINEDTLGQVPQAFSALNAQNTEQADHATSADSATDAQTLDGIDSPNFARSDQPSSFTDAGRGNDDLFDFSCDNTRAWGNRSTNINEKAAYWRDQFGVVHLRGTLRRCATPSSDTIFTLPAGFRPGKSEYFSVAAVDDTPPTAIVGIGADGTVYAPGSATNDLRSLDGITFRCEPSGSNGCP
jgi:hypothetical protein